MKTAALDLWFVRRDRWRAWGYAALILSAALLAWSANAYFEAVDRAAAIAAHRAEVQRAARALARPAVSPPSSEEAKAIARVDQALRYDWNVVFDTIEAQVKPPWSIVSVEAQRDRDEIKLVVERELRPDTPLKGEVFPATWKVVTYSETQSPNGARVIRATIALTVPH